MRPTCHIIATLFIILFSLDASAQNWQCIKTDGEYIYGILSSGDKTIRIDSVYHSSGFTYYINPPTIRWTGECQNPFGFSFLGKKIFSDNDGFYHFINSNNDTLHVNSNAEVNESWIFYSNEGENIRIWASIDAITFEPFSGTTDSVKIIKFTAKDTAGLNVQHTINSRNLKLSKHYGFSKIFNFDGCPQSTSTNTLVGINPIQKGYTNFGDKEIWDIQPGEEFHIIHESESSAPWAYSYSGTRLIKKCIDRWGNYDSALYLKYLVSNRYNSSGYATNIFDTVYAPYFSTEVIRFNDTERRSWNSAPGETYLFTDYSTTYATTYKTLSSSDSLYQTKEFAEPQIQRISDSCYGYQYVYEAGYEYCVKGAGGPYYSMYDAYGGDYRSSWSGLLLYSGREIKHGELH